MKKVKGILRHWLPLALLTCAFCSLTYLAIQQVLRMGANDPQIQIAEDTAASLASGSNPASLVPSTTVEISTSLAPFVIVLDPSGTIVATSGLLHGQKPTLPAGLLDYARSHGEDRVTWQPEPGVRMAAVIVPVDGGKSGFVLAGRSLREVEKRVDQLTLEVGGTLALTLVASLVIVALVEIIIPA